MADALASGYASALIMATSFHGSHFAVTLLALAVVCGCGQDYATLPTSSTTPPASTAVFAPASTAVIAPLPTAVIAPALLTSEELLALYRHEPLPVDLREGNIAEDLPTTLCDESFLAAGYEFGEDPELTVLHVASSSLAESPDGSKEAPFPTISEALQHAQPVLVRVEAGVYDEPLTLWTGQRVLGAAHGENSQGDDPGQVLIAANVTVVGAQVGGGLSVLENVEVQGSILVKPEARVVLKDNRIVFEAVSFSAPAVRVEGARVIFQGNELINTAAKPEPFGSTGLLVTSNSCARIVGNHIADFSTPIKVSESDDVAISFNVIAGGNNGFFLEGSDVFACGNHLQLFPPHQGCAYSVYMAAGSRPHLRHNTFQQIGVGSRGINEAAVESDPAELVGNTFHLQAGASVLYLNRLADPPEGELEYVTEIGDVAALTDISINSENTLILEP